MRAARCLAQRTPGTRVAVPWLRDGEVAVPIDHSAGGFDGERGVEPSERAHHPGCGRRLYLRDRDVGVPTPQPARTRGTHGRGWSRTRAPVGPARPPARRSAAPAAVRRRGRPLRSAATRRPPRGRRRAWRWQCAWSAPSLSGRASSSRRPGTPTQELTSRSLRSGLERLEVLAAVDVRPDARVARLDEHPL